MSNVNMPERPSKQQFFDEYIDISISEDQMQAIIVYSIYPYGQLHKDDFLQFLRKHKIVYGVNEELLEEICQQPERHTGSILKVAEGAFPVNGKDAVIQWNFDERTIRENLPDNENNNIDYKELDNVINVVAGKLLATKIPAEAGSPGYTVYGNTIAAKPGRNIPIKIGKNVVLDESGLKAYSIIDGQVAFTDGEKINVFPVYEVKGDVDYSIGNIDFVGSVVIRGNVLAGFSVRAGGDIRILGEVEAAEIDAQGSVEIRAGVVGQGKGSINAGHNITANYLNQANVHAKNDVVVGSIMHSNVKADRNVICVKGKGVIVGGRVQAGEGIEANVIGNVSQTPTTVEVGISPDLINTYNALKEKIVQIEVDLDKANKGVSMLNRQLIENRGQLPADKMELRGNLANAALSLQKILDADKQQFHEIEQGLDNVHNARIKVNGIAFPGTKLIIGKYVRHLRLEHSRISFRLEEGEIITSPV